MIGEGAEASAPQDVVTLRQLLAYDEDGILRLVLAPRGQDAELVGVIIGDEDGGRPYAGRIVLVTGVSAEAGAGAAEAVREAARRGAGAVVVRGRGDGDPA
ncbi:hypothetical protein ABZX29_16900, partial [Streptomyces zhihengii]